MGSYQMPVTLAFRCIVPKNGVINQIPVIFLHAVTLSKENWGDFPGQLAEQTRRKVYLVDARNHGDSPWSDEWNFDINVDDLLLFMDTEGIHRAVLVGHSMGAITAYKMALGMPERVDKVFAEDMTVRQIPESSGSTMTLYLTHLHQALNVLPKDLDETAAEEFIFQYIFDHLPEGVKEMARQKTTVGVLNLKKSSTGGMESKTNVDVLLKGFKKPTTLMKNYEGCYSGPVCIMYGGKSPFQISNHKDVIEKHFPNVQLIAVDEAGHHIHVDHPNIFQEALTKFLEH